MNRIVGRLLAGVLITALVMGTAAAGAPEAEAVAKIDRVMAEARHQGVDRLPFPQLVQAVAQLPSLLGKPYVAGTLDGAAAAESLRVSFDGFDCVTYVENVLALSRTLAKGGDAARFTRELADLRYRQGQPAYCERLHYFTDWIRSNAARGAVDDVTAVVAGDASTLAFHALPSGVDFMSRHASRLRALADSPSRQQCIAAAETFLSRALPHAADGEPGVSYIDTAHLADAGARLHGGDLLALVAETQGLDVIHVGIVLDGVAGGPLRFAHASSIRGQVSIAADLSSWLASSPRARGALVIRPRPPG